jgi:hypothetical protein
VGETHECNDEPSCQVDPDGVREIARLGVSFYNLELGDCRDFTRNVMSARRKKRKKKRKKTGRKRRWGEEEGEESKTI